MRGSGTRRGLRSRDWVLACVIVPGWNDWEWSVVGRLFGQAAVLAGAMRIGKFAD